MNDYYIVNYENGYLAYDTHSGGYPYSTSLSAAHKFSSLQSASAAASSEKGKSGKIFKCVVTVEEVSADELRSSIRETALAKLTDAERKELGL